MIIIVHCFLGNGYCTFGFLIFIIDEGNFLYYSLYILTEKSLKHLCSIRAWVPVSVCLSFCLSFFLFVFLSICLYVCLSVSVSLQLIPWSTETHLAHSPAQASKTLSRRHTVLHPLEKVPGAFVRDPSPMSRTLLVFCVNQGVSGSFSLSLSYRYLRTTRSGPLEDPNTRQ